jgi:P4 family phage/plasmid primase-like protien
MTTENDAPQAVRFTDQHGNVLLDDAHLGQYIAENHLRGRFLTTGGLGWLGFDGRHWEMVTEPVVFNAVRLAVLDLHRDEGLAGADHDRLKKISGLFYTSRIAAILRVAKGCLTIKDDELDAHPEQLNVGNGVIDLRTGDLLDHHPDLLLTKVTTTNYTPAAVNPDWTTALSALPDDDVRSWLQIRLGQGVTGHPVPDDVLVVWKGSGENGKTTIVDGVRGALGPGYAVTMPDRVLLSHTGDHPTELMTLRGARLALMEELPELGHLNVKRLKVVVGTDRISARYCGKDTVDWNATHTPFITTNYLPRVDETDNGTWRRLMLVDFPYRYRKPHEEIESGNDRKGDPGLRDRVRHGADQHEAALAWLVEGAKRWYATDRVMPEPPAAVKESTQLWRDGVDLLGRWLDDSQEFDPTRHVMSVEAFEDFTKWLGASGNRQWSDQTFTARLSQHPKAEQNGVIKKRGVRSSEQGTILSRRPGGSCVVVVPKQYTAWLGLKFRQPNLADFGHSPGETEGRDGL